MAKKDKANVVKLREPRSRPVPAQPLQGGDGDPGGGGGGGGAPVAAAVDTQPTRLPSEIVIPADREERHYSDEKMADLVASITAVGLINPIAITPDGRLVAGEHRLKAWQTAFGDAPIPVRIVSDDLETLLIMEFDENAIRSDYLPSELFARARKLEAIYRKRAIERQQHKAPADQGEKGRVRDIVAGRFGISPRTYAKIKAIGEAAEQEPARFAHLVDEMDRDGVDGPYKKLRKLQAVEQDEVVQQQPPFTTVAQLRISSFADNLLEEGVKSEGLSDRDAAIAVTMGCIRASARMCIGNGLSEDEFREFLEKTMEDFRRTRVGAAP